ncbi:MAG: Dbl homology domain-containing protein [Benniella sp.]|nr:MAG: Dbl homology domain-containing protein [Benniella sp.]
MFPLFFYVERFNESQLMEAERTHLQRESVVRHFYESEDDYLRSLRDIQSCYQKPLLLNLHNAENPKKTGLLSSSSTKAVATKQEIDTLFGNLDQLVEFHEEVQLMLLERSKIWCPSQIISDVLINFIPRLKIYSRYYTNFHAALTVLDRISRTAQYKKFIEQCGINNPRGTSPLHIMLAYPLKRLTTYRDMIGAICQATQSCHPDYHNLMRALDMIKIVSNELRDERISAEDQLALWDLQSTMVGLPEPIMIPNRRLILRADLHKVDSTLALESRTYYLMNDVLLYSRFDPKKNVYIFKGMFDMARTQINNPEDNVTLPQLPNCIQIANAGRKQMMRCRSRDERDHWMETMRQVVDMVNRNLDDSQHHPLRHYASSVSSDSSSSLGQHTSMTTGSIKSGGKPFTDSRSMASGSSNGSQGSTSSKPRKPNPQADFYGCSFGKDISVNPNEDNYKTSSLSHTLTNNSSSSSVSTSTGSTSTIKSQSQGLGAMLAAIPVDQLTPKQAKAKAALAAAVEARKQARMKQEMKHAVAVGGFGVPAKSEMNKNVNFDFSSVFIPAKERIAKSMS